MHFEENFKNFEINFLAIQDSRAFYIVLFSIFLVISIGTTALIYYFVRHKKKSFFDAAGRKYIESLGDYDMLLTSFEKMIREDDKDAIEREIVGNLKLKAFLFAQKNYL